jgi:hypothetical protein
MSEELENVREKPVTLLLGGEEREIKFGFSAWAMIEDEYGSISNFKKIKEEMSTQPFHTIPKLIFIGLRKKEGITKEMVADWLDEYGLDDIEELSKTLEKAMYATMPKAKKGSVATVPPKAGKK